MAVMLSGLARQRDFIPGSAQSLNRNSEKERPSDKHTAYGLQKTRSLIINEPSVGVSVCRAMKGMRYLHMPITP